MTIKQILPFLILAAVVAVGVWWFSTRPATDPTLPEQVVRTSEGTDIPKTAISLDGHAFVDESGVYLRSSFGTSSMKIPDADPESFRILSPFVEFGNEEIVAQCKGPGNYGFYGDKKKVYFFQVWSTPSFGKTKIEVRKELNPDTFAAAGPHTFTDGVQTVTIGYEFGTTTCEYLVEPV